MKTLLLGLGLSFTVASALYASPATDALLKEEEQPLNGPKATQVVEPSRSYGWQIAVAALVATLGGAGTYFGIRLLKQKGQWGGSRKYLIEQLSYCPLGTRSGVSLLKVGTEFVLVGVTPQQVTMLSRLPKLEAQFEGEASLERGAFREVVKEEYQKLNINVGNDSGYTT